MTLKQGVLRGSVAKIKQNETDNRVSSYINEVYLAMIHTVLRLIYLGVVGGNNFGVLFKKLLIKKKNSNGEL